jgi:small-conductance mechanosensitive channel
MKSKSLFFLAIALAFFHAAPLPAQEAKPEPSPKIAQARDWTGQWQTFWRDGQALLSLTQEGDEITGFYTPQDGQVEGRVEGRLIQGRWEGADASGGFVFALSPDGQTFTGRFDSGEYWNGWRMVKARERHVAFSAAISPRETLRTVITAANEANFEGNAAALQIYEPLLYYEGGEENGRQETRRRNLLWRLLNMSTFRVYAAPGRPESDTATFEIGPAGTAVRYTLRFRRNEEARWLILVESENRLQGEVARFLEALGYESVEEWRNDRRRSPRETLRRFLNGIDEWDAGGKERAMAALDLSYLPAHLRASEGPILVDYLKQILDRIGYLIWQEIPDDPNRPTPYRHYRHPAGNVTIERVRGVDGAPDEWKFSARTLQAAPELFAALQELPLAPGIAPTPPLTPFFQIRESIRSISPKLLDRIYLLENWQWIGLAFALALAILAAWLAGRLTFHWLFRFLRKEEAPAETSAAATAVLSPASPNPALAAPGEAEPPEEAADEEEEVEESLDTNNPEDRSADPEHKARSLAGPMMVFVGALILAQALSRLGVVQAGFNLTYRVFSLLTVVGISLVLYRAAGLIGQILLARAERTDGYADEIMTSLATGLIKLGIVIMGLLFCAEIVDLPYEGVITGLGVGGVALAFASRETVSNMLGGALLMTDRPFKRGDLVETDGQRATVVNVGLRSTRLRRLDDTILIIPNAQLSDKAIINWGVRERRRIDLSIGLTYATPRKKLDEFVDGLKALFRRVPEADSEESYIALQNFGNSSIDIEFWGFVRVFSYDEQIRIRHSLVGDIIDMAEEIGVSFAFPTRTVHMLHAPPDFELPAGKLSEPETEELPIAPEASPPSRNQEVAA